MTGDRGTYPPLNLENARILLSNDDGINANGLKALERIARAISDDIWVVAPETEQSGASHSLTLRDPLRIRRLEERRFAVMGTPTDSVLLAIRQIMKDHPPDLVLSGVNRGGNLGEDVTYSGTIAAAMEGTLLGVPSIALSLVVGEGRANWAMAEAQAVPIIRSIAQLKWPKNVLININFPDVSEKSVKGVKVSIQGRRKLGHLEERFDPRGKPYYWIGPLRDEDLVGPESDLAAVNDGYVAVTPIHLNLTEFNLLDPLRKLVET